MSLHRVDQGFEAGIEVTSSVHLVSEVGVRCLKQDGQRGRDLRSGMDGNSGDVKHLDYFADA